MNSTPKGQATRDRCVECGMVGYGRHEEWCSVGSNWLPEWFKRFQMWSWRELSIKRWQRGDDGSKKKE